jgi:hypothetical protein
MEIKSIFLQMGFNQSEVDIITSSEVQEEIDKAVDSFTERNRTNIIRAERSNIHKSSQAEFYEKATKQIARATGVDVTDEDKKDLPSFIEKAVNFVRSSSVEMTDNEYRNKYSEINAKYIDSQKTIKDLENEKLEIVDRSQKEIESRVNDHLVNEAILKISMNDQKYIIPQSDVVDIFKFKVAQSGGRFVRSENGFDLLDKDGNPVTRSVEGSKAVQFHNLQTFWEDVTKNYVQRSNGGGNPSPIEPIRSEMSPEQLRMLEQMQKL